MTAIRRRVAAVWLTGAVVGIAAEWLPGGLGDPLRWVPDLLVGWLFIGCGLTAATRQPDNRSGALMVATGFTWFLGNFATAEPEILGWLAASGIYLHRGPLVHLILAYPSGRLSSRTAQVAVGVGYASAIVAPIWDSEVLTLLLAALLIGVSARQYVKSVGRERRGRLLAVCAAAGLGLVLAGGAAARLVLPPAAVGPPALLAYQMTLAAIAGGFLVGMVLASWERADVTDLVVELGAARSETLRAALSRALGDPSLEVGYWFADGHSFVDAEGRVLSLPTPDSTRAVTRVERDNTPIAVIVHDPAVLDDPELRDAVTSATRLAASHARLQADVRARVVELGASRRRILTARDEQRRRLEERLHEGAERRLEALRDTLGRARRSTSATASHERLVRADEQLAETLEELRRLAQGLHPRILSERGLGDALASLADRFPGDVELDVTRDAMPPTLQTAAYFVCAEALANVAKHAAASKVRLTVTGDDARVTVVVEDDGVGGADPARGSGLRGMADRIATLGGTFSVDSAPGRGTRLTAELPRGGEGS